MTNFSKKTNGQFFQKKANAVWRKTNGQTFRKTVEKKQNSVLRKGHLPFVLRHVLDMIWEENI